MQVNEELLYISNRYQKAPDVKVTEGQDVHEKWTVAKEFETMFVTELFKSMRKTIPESDYMKQSQGRQVYTEMLDAEYAKMAGEKDDMGMASLIFKTMVGPDVEIPKESHPGEKPLKDSRVFIKKPATLPINDIYSIDAPLDKNQILEVPAESLKQILSLQLSHQALEVEQDLPRENSQDSAERSQFQNKELESLSFIQKNISITPDNTDKKSDSTFLNSKYLKGEKLEQMIQDTSRQFDLHPELLKQVVLAESGGNPYAKSPVGAKGLMQLMDGTAKDMGVRNVYNPQENLRGGAKYLKKMMNRFDGDLSLALAAYNAGPGNVDKYKGIPPFTETKNYVKNILERFNHATSDREDSND